MTTVRLSFPALICARKRCRRWQSAQLLWPKRRQKTLIAVWPAPSSWLKIPTTQRLSYMIQRLSQRLRYWSKMPLQQKMPHNRLRALHRSRRLRQAMAAIRFGCSQAMDFLVDTAAHGGRCLVLVSQGPALIWSVITTATRGFSKAMCAIQRISGKLLQPGQWPVLGHANPPRAVFQFCLMSAFLHRLLAIFWRGSMALRLRADRLGCAMA